MSIILASIYRDGLILADYTQSSGTFEQIGLEVANVCESGKNSYTKGQYVFHTLCDKGIVYLCMADINYMRADAYSFLEQIKRLLLEKCPQELSQKSTNYGLQKKLRNDIKQKFELFNSPEASKLRTAQHNLDILKDVIVQNLDKVLERNERLELIVQKSNHMTIASGSMKRQATAIRKQQQWKRIKLYIIIGVGSCLAIYILLVIICGGFGLGGCFGSSSKDDEENKKENEKRVLTVEQQQQQQCPLSVISEWQQKIIDFFSSEQQQEENEEQDSQEIRKKQDNKSFEDVQEDLATKIKANLRKNDQNNQQQQSETKKKIEEIKKALEKNQIEQIIDQTLNNIDQNIDLSQLFKN